MDFLLDMKTIVLSLVVGNLFTVVLISAYWRNHKKDAAIHAFFLAKCTQALAWLLIALRGGIPDVFTISIANSLLFVGAALETIAVLKLFRAFGEALKRIYIALIAIDIVGFHLVILGGNVEALRVAFASVGTTLFVFAPAFKLLCEKNASPLMKIMGSLYVLVIVTLIGRAAAALLSDQSMGFFTPGVFQSISFLTLYLVMIIGNTGFVLLLKEEADRGLVRLASLDDLTETLNRRTFILMAKECLEEHVKKKLPLTMVLFDVDHFKEINDSYGHLTGDRVLQDLSQKVRNSLAQGDLFGRHGGDEFVIMLPGMDEGQSSRVIEQMFHAAYELTLPDLQVPYTLSIGVLTVVPDRHADLESLYSTCDKALYQAKNSGRNRAVRIRWGS